MAIDKRLPDLEKDSYRVAALALGEDGDVDITTDLSFALQAEAAGVIEIGQDGVVAGTAYAQAVFKLCSVEVAWLLRDRDYASAGTAIARVSGDLPAILIAERPALNILQRACGIATATQQFVRAVAGTKCRILHTRKTAPGLRGFDIRAVLAGGGSLHRVSLAEEVMIKDNHWAALGDGNDLQALCAAAQARGVSGIYVEVETLVQVKQAVKAGATRLLVDNQSPEEFLKFVETARNIVADIEIEATGGITLENVRAYAMNGADFASIGALTHSVKAVDLALEIVEIE